MHLQVVNAFKGIKVKHLFIPGSSRNLNYSAIKWLQSFLPHNFLRNDISRNVQDTIDICISRFFFAPISVAKRSKARICGRSLAGIVGSEFRRKQGCHSFLSFVCCRVEVFATRRSPFQRSPADCGGSLCVI